MRKDTATDRTLSVQRLGRRDFLSTWRFQQELCLRRQKNLISDTILLVEHDPVYTIGKTGSEDNILCAPETADVPVVHIDRGGDITFHGHGQLVGYPILDLAGFYLDLHRYLRDLEEVLILTLADFGIEAGRNPGLTGVWVGHEKIAAIGVKVTRWTTMHGFALNVSTDLEYFKRINPCGIAGCGITSVKKLLNRQIPLDVVSDRVERHFREVFIRNPESVAARHRAVTHQRQIEQ